MNPADARWYRETLVLIERGATVPRGNRMESHGWP